MEHAEMVENINALLKANYDSSRMQVDKISEMVDNSTNMDKETATNIAFDLGTCKGNMQTSLLVSKALTEMEKGDGWEKRIMDFAKKISEAEEFSGTMAEAMDEKEYSDTPSKEDLHSSFLMQTKAHEIIKKHLAEKFGKANAEKMYKSFIKMKAATL